MADRGRRPAGALVHRRGALSLRGRVLQLGLLALSFVAVSLLVVTSSRAAFVAQSDNVTNQISSATVDLADNDAGTAMFDNVPALAPGTTVERCIDVAYSGTVDPTAVRLYASGTPSGTLPGYLDLTIEVGPDTPADFRDCTGFTPSGAPVYSGTLSAFASAHAGYATGVSTWDPASGPETRTFRFRLAVRDDAAAEGLTSTFGFSWETRTS